MRIPWTFVACMATGSLMATPASPPSYEASLAEASWNVHTEGVVKSRLATIGLPFEATVSDQVLDRIQMYVTKGRRETETILGRTIQYFPIFEHYLRQYDLPAELKYLPMIESGLRPGIRSEAGAVGMWQMMHSTARHYGLTINQYIDERRDPYRSTEAAVRLLRDLHKMFGDWKLVLIAYNGGSGMVQRAIRSAGCNDYAQVRRYLPGETQVYVPFFVAAAYVANFHREHQLRPRSPLFQLEQTRVLEIHQYVEFQEIARVTGVDVRTIARLNPACLRGAVPKSRKGYYLVLPAGATTAARHLLESKDLVSGNGVVPPNTFRYAHIVRPGEDLRKIARVFRCSVEDIMRWNGMAHTSVVVQQELTLFLSRAYVFNRA